MINHINTLKSGKPTLITRQIIADGISAVNIFSNLMKNEKYAFLLESVTGGDSIGRYSIMAIDPDLIWSCKDGKASIKTEKGTTYPATTPLESLEEIIKDIQMEIPEGLPPMISGLVGMMGYEMVREVENLPSDKEGPSGLPDGCFIRPQITLVHDNVSDKLTIATTIWTEGSELSEEQAKESIDSANSNIDAIINKINNTNPLPTVSLTEAQNDITYKSDINRNDFIEIVEKAKEYILSGDIFQIVPSIRFTKDFKRNPLSFYRALRHLNPSPYMFHLKLDTATIIGSSPEILVKSSSGKITLRPLAGTRKRGDNEAEDKLLEEELLNDSKEISEHLMLLDLGRNDIGRVAKAGSVKVTEQMKIERYSHVMHIVSNVEGELEKNKSSMQALMAGFPAGTVTGAPKIRAMQILDELEPHKRGFYGGCVGYFSTNGDMDSCITLRTALIKDDKLHLQAGAGVVADSNPESEYEEICNKAKALMQAAAITENFETA